MSHTNLAAECSRPANTEYVRTWFVRSSAQTSHSLIYGQVHRYEIRFRLRRAFNFSDGPRVLICDQLCLSTVIYRCFILFAFSQRRWVVRHDLRTMFTNTFQRLYHRANEPITDRFLQILQLLRSGITFRLAFYYTIQFRTRFFFLLMEQNSL